MSLLLDDVTLVESTDPDLLGLSRTQVHSEGEELKHEGVEKGIRYQSREAFSEGRKSTVPGCRPS